MAARRTVGNRPLDPAHADAIAAAVKRLRAQHGYSQETLAQRAGVSTLQVVRIESGRGNPTVATLVGLAAALRVPVTTLIPF